MVRAPTLCPVSTITENIGSYFLLSNYRPIAITLVMTFTYFPHLSNSQIDHFFNKQNYQDQKEYANAIENEFEGGPSKSNTSWGKRKK